MNVEPSDVTLHPWLLLQDFHENDIIPFGSIHSTDDLHNICFTKIFISIYHKQQDIEEV